MGEGAHNPKAAEYVKARLAFLNGLWLRALAWGQIDAFQGCQADWSSFGQNFAERAAERFKKMVGTEMIHFGVQLQEGLLGDTANTMFQKWAGRLDFTMDF